MASPKPKPSAPKPKSYRVLIGLNYSRTGDPKDDQRREPGDICTDLPESSVPWLLEQGAIEAIEEVDE